MKNKIFLLISSIIFSHLAGVIGAFATRESVGTWYQTLEKPFFTPPGWVFGPVWITLYTLMGISLYLIIIRGFKKKEVKIALMFFGLNWILNAVWSIIFFGLHNPLVALLEIIILDIIVVITIIKFWKINKVAGLLLVPYILWLILATALNFAIFYLN